MTCAEMFIVVMYGDDEICNEFQWDTVEILRERVCNHGDLSRNSAGARHTSRLPLSLSAPRLPVPVQLAACYTDTCFASYLQIGWYKTFLAIENISKHLLALRLSGWCLCLLFIYLEGEHFSLLFMAVVRPQICKKEMFFPQKIF